MILSLCADSASREALGYATDLPALDRDDGLVELEKLSLVNKKGDRFWLLPLTKQFAAAEFQTSPDKGHLREKWVEYFKKLSEEYSGEHLQWRNYDWLMTEGENILSIAEWAIAADQGKIALSFTHSVLRYLATKSRGSKLTTHYGEQLENIAQSLRDKRSWAWICLHWLGWRYVERGDIDRARTFAKRSLSLYRELGDIKGMCWAMNRLGLLLQRENNDKAAKEMFEKTKRLAQENNYGDGIADVHFELGKLARDRGEWNESKMHWEAIIEWCENHEDESNLDISFLMAAIGNLGWVEFHLGNSHCGKELIERSLVFHENKGEKGHMATLHLRLAAIEHALGNREKALEHLQETLYW